MCVAVSVEQESLKALCFNLIIQCTAYGTQKCDRLSNQSLYMSLMTSYLSQQCIVPQRAVHVRRKLQRVFFLLVSNCIVLVLADREMQCRISEEEVRQVHQQSSHSLWHLAHATKFEACSLP